MRGITAIMAAMREHHEVVVVGGGQAGLAIGHHLAAQGRGFTILEAAAEPAAAWRSRWDSLTLFTPVRHDSLPGLAFEGDPGHYPSRDEVVAYLTGYARHFDLPVRLGTPVRSLRREDGAYVLDAGDRALSADQVVVATGPFQAPRVPAIAGALGAGVLQLHSAAYRRPDDVPPGPVLVVGGGNTGFQIAAELAATHEVHLAIGSRQVPLPQRLAGADLFTVLTATGLMAATRESRIGRRMRDRETLIGSSPRAARRRGIALHPRAAGAQGETIRFADASQLEVRTVIWATGFAADHGWIDVPVFDAAGAVAHVRGVTRSEGLYFLGLPWQHTRGSALLGWVKDDAAHLAEAIAARAARRPAPALIAP
jgi:putative flavoprotein involved in K+ transport